MCGAGGWRKGEGPKNMWSRRIAAEYAEQENDGRVRNGRMWGAGGWQKDEEQQSGERQCWYLGAGRRSGWENM